MTTNYAAHVSTKKTPQSEPIPGQVMVANSAGGFSFAVDDWTRLDRFLLLGSEGGSYYVTERKLTQENAGCVLRCLGENGPRTVERIAVISESGRAPKNDPALFAPALCAVHAADKAPVYAALPRVARIGTHLFQFVVAVNELRGWGRGLRRAVGDWYMAKSPRDAAFQCLKYQSRGGWSHRDLLRLAHPKAEGPLNDVFHWTVKGWDGVGDEPHPEEALRAIWAFEWLKRHATVANAVRMIADYGLTREMVPTELLTDPAVWDALLVKMPLTALVRNLATMTRVGLLAPLSAAAKSVCDRLSDADYVKKSRLHPLAILIAQKTYAQGRGERAQNTWVPMQEVVDALDGAFYAAFGNVPVTGKNWFYGLDVSGSMSVPIAGTFLSCCEAATALALVTSRVEVNTFIGRFNTGIEAVPFGKKTRLDDALRYTQSINGGGTDCSLPMIYALERKMSVNAFVVLTDSETWAGDIHPIQALAEYRQRMGIPAKLIVVGMVSNGFTIADPDDAGMMDVVGFDTATPVVIGDFVTSGDGAANGDEEM